MQRDVPLPSPRILTGTDLDELATEYANVRGKERGSDGYVIYEVDVPDAAVVEVQSWWWAEGQLLLPFGAPVGDDADRQRTAG